MNRRAAIRCLGGAAVSACVPAGHSETAPSVLSVGGARIEVSFASSEFDVPRQAMLDWVTTGARAVSGYFGRFPVRRAKLEIAMSPGRRGGRISGVTYGEGGAHSRVAVARNVSAEDLQRDWVMTHEMVHYGFPSMDEEHNWIEEGSATYIEPIARAAVGNLTVERVWADMVRDMPQGLPGLGDQGLDHTHTWGRKYWGGAIFCLVADVQIREKTANRLGLMHALRAVTRAGGNIESDWPLEKALQVGDRATGTQVLAVLYEQMAKKSMPVDLGDLWRRLGVRRENGQVFFDANAPLAKVRQAIAG